MKVIVKSIARGAEDQSFKNVKESVLATLIFQGWRKYPEGVTLEFECLTPVSAGNLKPVEMDTVTVCHTRGLYRKLVGRSFIQAVVDGVSRLGRRCILQPIDS